MARQFAMSFNASQKRWFKLYKGKMYAVSCRQLGALPTKLQSWMHANAWWEAKQAEIDAKEKADAETPEKLAEPRVVKALGVLNAEELTQKLRDGYNAHRVGILQEVASDKEGLDYLIELELEGGKVSEVVRNLTPSQTPIGRSVAEQVQSWLNVLQSSVSQNLMNSGRYESYERHIGLFAKWFGEGKDVSAITALKLEEWYSFLCVQIAEKKYAPSTVKTIYMTTRQFLGRLQELSVIAPLGNLHSRRFKFNEGVKEVVRLSNFEIQKLITDSSAFSKRTTLYILLCLNCGFYQNDIAELSEDEVNWDNGTISRPRSKIQSGAKTTWKLWNETFELLKEFRAKTEVLNKRKKRRVILTEDGNALCDMKLEGGKLKRYDVVVSALGRLAEKTGKKFPIKILRKTSASELASHPTYSQYVQYFLAHSPKGVTDRNYIKPDDTQFFLALEWLHERFFGEGN